MNVNYELYKYFYYVAKDESFSRAASFLNVTQPAISQAIKQLEDKTKTKLFLRNGRTIRLTEEGKILYNYLDKAFSHIYTAENYLKQMNNMEKGEIRIGISESACKFFLLPYIKEFRTKYPELKLLISNKTSPNSIENLVQGDIDVAFVMLPLKNLTTNIHTIKLKKCKSLIISSPNFVEKPNERISIKELQNHPFVMLDNITTTRKIVERMFEQYGINPTTEIELGSVPLVIDFLKIGFGISMILEDYVKDDIEKGELFEIPIQEELPELTLVAATYKDIPPSKASKIFLDFISSKYLSK